MSEQTISGVHLLYQEGEAGTAEIIAGAIERSLELAGEMWGFNPPADCRMYVMTSWLTFIFQSAPWTWKLMLAATLPLWAGRARRTWPYSAGWTQRYGRRTAIGIKPPALLEKSDKSIGIHMYVEEPDPEQKIRHLACHELVHACSAHLSLPAWLNEGIAVLTVDRYLGKQTIRQDTLELIQSHQPKGRAPSYRELSRLQGKMFAYHAVRGYWYARYLQDLRPGYLKVIFTNPQKLSRLESELEKELNLEPGELWLTLDDLLYEHFSQPTA